jgi:co-chaperonin GroES (HSP10)
MKSINDVMPIPTGQKMFVTADKNETFKTETGLIIPDGAAHVELLDVQTVAEVGLYMKAEAQNKQVTVEPGDIVHINWNSKSFWKPKTTDRFADRMDGSGIQDTERSTRMEFSVPMYTFEGVDYLLIDKNDIDFLWKKDSLAAGTDIDNKVEIKN